LGIDQNILKINCDSISVIYLAKSHVYHARMKRTDVTFHFVREVLEEGDIKLQKIHTKENPPAMLTKVILRMKFADCKELFHILLIT